MIFCGQCGFQLASGDTHCPRCGATVAADGTVQASPHRDDPTIASLSSIPLQPNTPPPYPPAQLSPQTQQKLVLPSNTNDYDQGAPTTYNPTNMGTRQSYPTYAPNTQMGTSYPGNLPSGNWGGYQPQSGQYPVTPAPQSNPGRVLGLIFVLLGLLLVLAAMVVFALQHSNTPSGNTGNLAATLAIPVIMLMTSFFPMYN